MTADLNPDPTTHQRVVAAIRKGAFPHVAAEAAGVAGATFRRWMARGRRPEAPEPLRAFVAEVRAARAWARLVAEVHVHDQEVLNWLRYGPGRDREASRGWAAAPRPLPRLPSDRCYNAHFLNLLSRLLGVLNPYPEARKALADFLNRVEGGEEPPRKNPLPAPGRSR
jgi:hypothetical protein